MTEHKTTQCFAACVYGVRTTAGGTPRAQVDMYSWSDEKPEDATPSTAPCAKTLGEDAYSARFGDYLVHSLPRRGVVLMHAAAAASFSAPIKDVPSPPSPPQWLVTEADLLAVVTTPVRHVITMWPPSASAPASFARHVVQEPHAWLVPPTFSATTRIGRLDSACASSASCCTTPVIPPECVVMPSAPYGAADVPHFAFLLARPDAAACKAELEVMLRQTEETNRALEAMLAAAPMHAAALTAAPSTASPASAVPTNVPAEELVATISTSTPPLDLDIRTTQGRLLALVVGEPAPTLLHGEDDSEDCARIHTHARAQTVHKRS